MLNRGQQEALELAREGHNLLIMGSAGTGKSHVLTEIFDNLTEEGKKVQLTCSTGIACTIYKTRYNAVTIHQFSGIEDGRYDPDKILTVLKNTAKADRVIRNIMSTDVLIVDECSMISQRTFNSLCNVCSMKDPSKLCGGIQVIFCGDFMQLPPVPNKRYNDNGNFCFQSPFFNEVFPHRMILTENVRQNQDAPFVRVLSEISKGLLSEEGRSFLKNMKRNLPEDCESVKLFSTNSLVDDYNRNCLLNLDGNMYEFSANDTKDINALKEITAPKILWLKVGCPVILLRNLSQTLVNGLRGILVGVGDTELTIRFPSLDLTTGIQKANFTVFDPKTNTIIATRNQFPVKPAYALTIHKAQGMTLPWVEVDCRDIFKTGQLGVAMSRAASSDGLRVINFHPRYIFRPPAVVSAFMNEASDDRFPDLSCCRLRGLPKDDPSTLESQSSTTMLSSVTSEADELDDEFNDVIAAIDSNEGDTLNFEIPENFHLKDLLAEIRFKTEHTEVHTRINSIISKLEQQNSRCLKFVKKVMFKMSTVIRLDMQQSGTIPENKLSKVFAKVHEYSTSLEYTMDCLALFEIGEEDGFEEAHVVVCYKILEYVREFMIEQKVSDLQPRGSKIMKRFVTEASRPRIRYVAGYCVASLRKRYTHLKQSNMFSNSKAAQSSFKEAKVSLKIITALREEEHYLKDTTTDPDSLVDIDRRQNVRRGLTNVTDHVYDFFLCLTKTCMAKLVHENLVKYGESMYNKCLDLVRSDSDLYEKFSHMVIAKLQAENVEEFHESQYSLPDYLENMVILSAQVYEIYKELVQKYFMVLFAQFRRDVKSALKVQKTMAHRKQIKVTKGTGTSTTAKQSVTQTKRKITKQKGNTRTASSKSVESPQAEPQPGPSFVVENEMNENKAADSDTDSDSGVCAKCHLGGKDWIQCDSCNSWLHRKCAGLSNCMKWKKYSKESATWYCQECA